ncbi:phage tail protein [Vibrio cyclitrophicus]|nr:phage tail protein [Vibrio cyclitrophicus]PMJ34129.1 hypothetical protein BCU25_09400 [Vibrio cyclitrophicus]
MANTTDKSILTAAGKALLAQLNAEEKPLIIDKMIFANVPNRSEFPQPDDVVPTDHVVHQEGVEQRGRLSADSVIYSTTLTSDVGPFEFNWTGAYCSEYGVLVTIDHHALTPKSADEPGVAGNTLVRSVVLEYKDIAEITNITVDASSWQYNATPRMKKMDDDVAQAIIDQNGKDWFIEDGFLVTPQASAFNIKAGAGYVSGNRVTLEFDRNVQVPNKPSFIYVDAHREGTPTGEQVTLFDFVITAEEKDDYTDANGVKHFVCKIAQVLADGSVSDLRPEGESASRQYVSESNKRVQEEILGRKSKIYPLCGDLEEGVEIPDDVQNPYTHVRLNGEVYAMSPPASGVVSNLTETNADIGDVTVIFYSNTYTVRSYSDLPNLRLKVNDVVKTQGRYEPGDNGGCEYVITVADAEKLTAGIQTPIHGMLAAEIINFNDVYVEQIGVRPTSSVDATLFLQPYIDYFKSKSTVLKLKFRLITYFLHTELDLLNIGNNAAIVLEGVQKTRINKRGTGTILYANTGRIGILTAGVENVTIKNLSVFSDPNNPTLLNPSNIGLVLARTLTFPYCQHVILDSVHISCLSNNPSEINEGRGAIGIYNYASETHEWNDVSVEADTPLVKTNTNCLYVNYTDKFVNDDPTKYTTTNFDIGLLQLYPSGNAQSTVLLENVRELNVSTLLGYGRNLTNYLFDIVGDLPTRRIYINNIHTENIKRFARIGTPLLESNFTGKVGDEFTDSCVVVADDGRMVNVDFNLFTFSSGNVKLIDDRTTNQSFNVKFEHSRETNGANVDFEYALGNALYSNFTIKTDSQVNTVNSKITALAACIIKIIGTDGTYDRGTYYRGMTAERPTTGLYEGKEWYDKELGIPIWWNGGNWRNANQELV